MVFAPHARLQACAVPVFQYAMANWPPDDYTLLVLHRGPLEDSHHERLESWQQSPEFLDANIQIRTRDLDQASEDDLLALPYLGDVELPAAVLQYPPHSKGPPAALTTSLEDPIWTQLFTSPVRQRIARNLRQGETATWVLLESGDAAKDRAAAQMLETQLSRLEAELVPGEQPDNPVGDVPQTDLESDDIPVKFSLIRLSRNDAVERLFIRLLLGSEHDLDELDEPMAFPIFGRGRVLYALAGGGIEPGMIAEACAFLVGGCSCVVKIQNPGTDLLFAQDWEAPLDNASDSPMPQTVRSETRVTEVANEDATPDESAEPAPGLWRQALLGIGLGVGIVGVAGVLFLRKGRPE